MKRAVAVFLLVASLVASSVFAADVPIKVGGPAGELVFDPAVAKAKEGDNLVFTWQGPKMHSVLESDAAKSCAKSKKPDAQFSGGAFAAPKEWTVKNVKAGKTWFYCGVPGHCEAGMYMTVDVAGADGTTPAPKDAPKDGAPKDAPKDGAPSESGAPAAAPSAPAKSAAARNNAYAAGFLLSGAALAASLL